MNLTRIIVGLFIYALIAWLVSNTFGSINIPDYLKNFIFMFISSLCGSFVAGNKFLMPVLITFTIIWVYNIYILVNIANPYGTVISAHLIYTTIIFNKFYILSGLAGVLIGTYFGQKLSSHKFK